MDGTEKGHQGIGGLNLLEKMNVAQPYPP